MMEQIDLRKTVYNKRQYEKVIPTKFTQLLPQEPTLITSASLPTIDQFFNYYNQLFYNIPQRGNTNSHEYLIQQSSLYVGTSQSDEEIQALLAEIQSLRSENLSLNEQIVNTQKQQNATTG